MPNEEVVHLSDGVQVAKVNEQPDWAVGIDALANREETRRLVEEVRQKFMVSYESEKEQYNAEDVQVVFLNTESTYVERYLLRRNLNVEKTVNMIKKALKHFKAERFTPFKESQFPPLFYEYPLYYLLGSDKDGNTVLHIKMKLYHKVHAAATDTFLKYMIHLVLKAGSSGYERQKGYTVCADLTGFSLRQVDIPNLIQITKSSVKYCPWGLRKVLVYNLQAWMKPLLKTLLIFLPSWIQGMIVLVDNEKLTDHIVPQNLPKYLGGLVEEYKKTPLRDCPTLEDYFWEKYKLDKKESRKILEKFKEIQENHDDN